MSENNRNLLIITQKVDENDDLLGSFVDWIREFSKRFDEVNVVTLGKGEYRLPENVKIYSLGKEDHVSKLKQFFRLYKYLFKLVPKSIGVFSHMSPIFSVVSYPVTKIYGKKNILWYLHRSVTLKLRLALLCVDRLVTANKDSLRIKSKKIIETGHGINISKFSAKSGSVFGGKTIRILTVGRISPIKNLDTLIQSISILKNQDINVELSIIGKPVMDYDKLYFEKLKKMINDLGIQDIVNWIGFVPYSKIEGYYHDTDIVVNLTPNGGIDKVVLEAMASSRIVLTSNEIFKNYLGEYAKNLIFIHGDSNDLASKISEIIKMGDERRNDMIDFLSTEVSIDHSVNNVVDRISNLFI